MLDFNEHFSINLTLSFSDVSSGFHVFLIYYFLFGIFFLIVLFITMTFSLSY